MPHQSPRFVPARVVIPAAVRVADCEMAVLRVKMEKLYKRAWSCVSTPHERFSARPSRFAAHAAA
jgi:hypothetical protein